MGKYDSYIARVTASGNTFQEDVMSSTKRQAYEYIMNSPTKSDVSIFNIIINEQGKHEFIEVDKKVTIVSEKTGKTFHEKSVLFLPDEDELIGTYMLYKNRMYLATEISDIEGYPQAFVEHCNYFLDIKVGEDQKIQTGTNSRGRPIFEYITPTIKLPVKQSSKIYSELNNSQVPLPEGAIMIKVPYHKDIKIKVNDEFFIHGDKIQVTTVSSDDLYFNSDGSLYGYYTVRGQKGDGVEK
ncbi:hypothetical protein [Sporosarcina sp. FSL W7-1283]|uniref:hypothetical protein n=1 Tax=Sporosarcina sp. FSL W7-1283 TaxID=2921560 RepID=UPI0030F4C6C0